MTAATAARPVPVARTRHPSAVRRLVTAELRLATREPIVLTFVLTFPIVTMLIIGNSFGTDPDPAFMNADPSQWYVASYFTVVVAAVGLIMIPVHLAAYRERGVLRRFAAAGFPRWSFAVAVLVLGLVTVAVAAVALLIVALPVFGIPTVESVWRVALATVLGAVAFVSIGVLLGTALPSARAAQAVGLMLFFPSFLLGAGGPPPRVLGDAMRTVADVLPLTWVTKAIREPWLGLSSATPQLLAVAVLAVVTTALAVRRTAL
ncbi:ABC transporter permease [Jatrophihabitans fulvus]